MMSRRVTPPLFEAKLEMAKTFPVIMSWREWTLTLPQRKRKILKMPGKVSRLALSSRVLLKIWSKALLEARCFLLLHWFKLGLKLENFPLEVTSLTLRRLQTNSVHPRSPALGSHGII
jgi:hypothetical protein